MTGNCRLCAATNCELQFSHIIPEFNYKPCYDEKHRFFRLSTESKQPKKFEQKGYREYLLCRNCETKLSQWEGYAKSILTDGGLSLTHQNDFGFVFGGADYERFKLYAMSVLWRMSVSSLDFFQEVHLGPHEKCIREALLADDPLEPHQYPFILTAVTIKGKFLTDFIGPPSLAKTDGQHMYRTVINGIVYSFVVGSHRADAKLEEMALTRNGTLKIAVMPIENFPYLHHHVLELAKAMRANDGQQRS